MNFLRRIGILILLISSTLSCEKNSYNSDLNFTARVVGYDLNCSTCILEFPYDTKQIINEIGESHNNYYEAINLDKATFKIGEQITCLVRNPRKDELRACIALYPSFDYRSIYVEKVEGLTKFILNDTLTLPYHNCLSDPDNIFYVCLDSVVNDSRCPPGVECYWIGLATVKLKLLSNQDEVVYFNLTTLGKDSTTIHGYNIKLVGLDPYPSINYSIKQEEYKAKLYITKRN